MQPIKEKFDYAGAVELKAYYKLNRGEKDFMYEYEDNFLIIPDAIKWGD